MAIMLGDLHAALVDAGASDTLATKAAQEVAAYESDIGNIKQDLSDLRNDTAEIKREAGRLTRDVADLKSDVGALKRDGAVLKVMVGTLYPMVLAILFKLFLH